MSLGRRAIVRECREVGQTPGPLEPCVQVLLLSRCCELWPGVEGRSSGEGLTAFSAGSRSSCSSEASVCVVDGFVRLSVVDKDESAEISLDRGLPALLRDAVEADEERN